MNIRRARLARPIILMFLMSMATLAAAPPQSVKADSSSSTVYTLSWQGYDWDGTGEETVALNGQFLASLPATYSPQNGGAWVAFSLNTTLLVQGTNTLTFTHANFDCPYIDRVRNIAVTSETSTVYGNATVENINTATNCTNTLTYTFTIRAPPPPPPPQLIGWGGVGLGETLSDIQTEMQGLNQSGYNAVRVDFGPTCSSAPDTGVLGSYNATKLGQVIALAKQYGLWVMVDYHGHTDLQTSSTEQCWLGFWKSLVENFTLSYSQIIWEPINEPLMTNNIDVTGLSSAYQALIDEVRALGDTHWIVVQNLCSSNCGFSAMSQGYPTVTDPLGNLSQGGRIFISLHSYMGYQYYSGSWNNATADALAQQFYNAVVTGMQTTGWPALNTEGGADPQVSNCSGPPDCVLSGSAGYSVTTFHFIQTLTKLYDANTPQRINWVWWPAGSWTDTPGAGIYGALQCNSNPAGWGCLLTFAPLAPLPPPAQYTLSFQGYAFDGANEETLTVNGAVVANIPQVFTPANGAAWVSFSFNITAFVQQGTNTISFTHANSDCPYFDQVRNLAVTSQTSTIYSNATVENVNTPSSCTNTLTYAFTV